MKCPLCNGDSGVKNLTYYGGWEECSYCHGTGIVSLWRRIYWFIWNHLPVWWFEFYDKHFRDEGGD